MIPWDKDDGFTTDFGFCRTRPMLGRVRDQVVADPDSLSQLLFCGEWFAGNVADVLADVNGMRAIVVASILSSPAEEKRQWDEFRNGIDLIYEHGPLLRLSCDDCRRFATDHTSGCVLIDRAGKPIKRTGLPVPCETARCPKGHWSAPVTPSDLAWKAWQHYWRVKAAGVTIDDEIFSRNAAHIEWVINGRDRKLNPSAR